MSNTRYVTLGDKQYRVSRLPGWIRQDGSTEPDRLEIWTSWEVPSVAESRTWTISPTMITRSASVSIYGRLGKKVLAELAKDPEFLSGM
jgi:hypothetical protein